MQARAVGSLPQEADGTAYARGVTITSGPLPQRDRLFWAVGVGGLSLETLLVAGMAVLAIVRELGGAAQQATAGLGVTLFLCVVCLGLAAVTHGVLRRRRWASAPGITVQLLVMFAFAWPYIRAGATLVGAGLMLLAVVTGVTLIVQARSLPTPRRFGD